MKSLWIEEEPNLTNEIEELREDQETEVCIIGGGITGISIAYELTKRGKKVIILEKDKLAEKATGNTTAKITSQHDLIYDYLVENYGIKYAKKYYNSNQEAIKNIEEIIKSENIECDFEKQDAYVFTQDAKKVEEIQKEIKAVKAIGGEAEFAKTIEANLENIQRSNKISKSSQI
ncbi:MAG: FAD-binding oxidoreductase [Clostridia bacterium]|jgi:glycine/D-amino acid oxidase-like deaminating enzyme|nr:FAD-binding oxidoreductase [Clostridia bacterium]